MLVVTLRLAYMTPHRITSTISLLPAPYSVMAPHHHHHHRPNRTHTIHTHTYTHCPNPLHKYKACHTLFINAFGVYQLSLPPPPPPSPMTTNMAATFTTYDDDDDDVAPIQGLIFCIGTPMKMMITFLHYKLSLSGVRQLYIYFLVWGSHFRSAHPWK